MDSAEHYLANRDLFDFGVDLPEIPLSVVAGGIVLLYSDTEEMPVSTFLGGAE